MDARKPLTAGSLSEGVSETADRLQISEFQLFKTAYCAWFGQVVTDARVEDDFIRYMFGNRTPPWVRHFVRRARHLESVEQAIPPVCAINRRTLTPRQRLRGWFLLVGITVFAVLFCLMLVFWMPPN